MSVATNAPINPEEADNFEEIEKQFAVKGIQVPPIPKKPTLQPN